MKIIAQVNLAMRNVLTSKADELGRSTGFIKRQVKVTGSWFAQTVVFGWLQKPTATLEELTQTGASLGVVLSPQALDQRFSEEASQLLCELVAVASGQVVSADPVMVPLLRRFNGVYLGDSTVISLPNELAKVWPGNGGHAAASQAAVKVEVGFDLLCGRLVGPLLEAGRRPDRGSALQRQGLPPGSLRITDLGYWSLDQQRVLSDQEVFWLLRINPQVHFWDDNGQLWDLVDFAKAQRDNRVDSLVRLGAKKGVPARLLGVRVPTSVAAQRRRKLRSAARREGRPPSPRLLVLAAWSFFVTNLSPTQLSLEEALVLARLRWQIELLFKLWKSHGQLDTSVSHKPWRILCEFYAKLIAMILQHWLLLTCSWTFPDRSLPKAASTVRQHALALLLTLADPAALEKAIAILQRCLQHGCRINKSKKTLRTFQLLLQFGEIPA